MTKDTITQTHEIVYPGFDYQKCSICGWIPTQSQIDWLEKKLTKIRQERTSKKITETEKELDTEIKLGKLKIRQCKLN